MSTSNCQLFTGTNKKKKKRGPNSKSYSDSDSSEDKRHCILTAPQALRVLARRVVSAGIKTFIGFATPLPRPARTGIMAYKTYLLLCGSPPPYNLLLNTPTRSIQKNNKKPTPKNCSFQLHLSRASSPLTQNEHDVTVKNLAAFTIRQSCCALILDEITNDVGFLFWVRDTVFRDGSVMPVFKRKSPRQKPKASPFEKPKLSRQLPR